MTDEDYDNLASLVAVWGATADFDELPPSIAGFESNDEEWSKSAIRADIVPFYLGKDLPERFDVRDLQKEMLAGLRFALKASDEEIHRVWDNILIAFPLPDNPRDFFVWIKEVFEEHQIHLTDYD